jgi:predicted O-methyltransferase YrrM
MNEAGQLDLLTNFNFQDELDRIPLEGSGDQQFYYRNSFFGPGDADFLYSMIRYFRPRRIVEVGSGYSTLVMLRAIDENRRQNPVYQCEVTCVEPYEADWLESRGVTVIRRPVEEVGPELFSQLESDDILFIDSSHVIKPRGDVLFLYLQVLPLLSSGVLVQIHDVFTPRDYLKRWVVDELKLWNEQYLLEAFLSHNRDFRIIGALNYLKHRHQERLAGVFPILGREPLAEPGSLWLRRA